MRNRTPGGADRHGAAPVRTTDRVVFGQLTRRELAALALIVLFATALRLYGLGARPLFWQDELGLWEYIVTGDASWMPQEAPLYARLQFVWVWWTQTPTANSMRLLSIGLGSMGVVAAFALGRLFGGVRVGLLAAILLSISPMALALAHEVRPYTLFILASTILLACFSVAWERNTAKAWLAYGLALTTVLLTHLLAAQLCLALALTVVAAVGLERKRPKVASRLIAFAGTSIVFGLLGAAWVALHLRRGAILTGPYGPGPVDFLQGAMTSLGGVVESQLPLAVTLALLSAVGLVVLARRQPVHAILLGNVIGVSCIVTYATMEEMSSWGWTAWQRYLSHLLVPYLVLVAVGSAWIARVVVGRVQGPARSALVAAITLVPVLLVVPGAGQWLGAPDRHPRIKQVAKYATFACEHQHEVQGFIYVKGLTVRTPGISTAYTRQYYGYEQVRHDSLASYSVGNWGVREIVKRPGRGEVGLVPEYVPLSSPPADGRYIVFPPGVPCDALANKPYRGVRQSVEASKGRWGLICDIRFER
jgi:hypothetical protein